MTVELDFLYDVTGNDLKTRRKLWTDERELYEWRKPHRPGKTKRKVEGPVR